MVLRTLRAYLYCVIEMELKGARVDVVGENDYRIIFDHDALQDMDIALSKLPEERRAGAARAFLAASATTCMAGAVNYMLRARDVKVNGISASSSVHMGKNEKGTVVVDSINIEVIVDVPEEGTDVLEHCISLLENGCLVTRSLKRGIKVNHSIIKK